MTGKGQTKSHPNSSRGRKIVSNVMTMKQPDLGMKIVELRTAKGFTQEDLVEMCNISVRTIQRIEAGEVTPRSYTVKTIFAALEYDISKIPVNETGIIDSVITGIKRFLLLEVDLEKPSDFLIRQLNIAWIFGILYFAVGFLESGVEYLRYDNSLWTVGNVAYIIIKVVTLITYVYFQRGFILVGGLFKNYLIRITSFILIFATIITIGYDIASLFYDAVEREFILGGEAITFGGIAIIYGMALYRLRHSLGDAATLAGIFEIIGGVFLMTIILALVGLVVLIPAQLLEIVVLYKAVEIVKSKSESDLSGIPGAD